MVLAHLKKEFLKIQLQVKKKKDPKYLIIIYTSLTKIWVSLVAERQRIWLSMQEMQVWSLGQEEPQEKEMATNSGFLAWEIPWGRSLVGYSPWGHKGLDMT